MTWDALSSNSLHYVQSDVETRAFGVETARIIVGANAPDNLEMVERFSAIVSQASEHVLIVRWPAHLTSIGIALSQSGRRIYPADTLMYWDVATPDLTQHRTHRHDLDLLPLSEAGTSSAELERLVGEVFVHYVNHYSANPLLAHVPVARGYCDWVRRRSEDAPDDALVLMAECGSIGFALVNGGIDRGNLEVELAGVTAAYQGKHAYESMLVGLGTVAAARDLPRLVISTQAQNIRAQRAWSKAGLRPLAAIATAHANLR